MFPAEAGSSAQLLTSVGPDATVWQVMLPPGVQLPTGTGVHCSVEASHERSWERLRLTCDVWMFCCDVAWNTW